MTPKPRKALVLVAVAISSFALTGCGDQGNSTESVTGNVVNEVTETITSTFDPIVQGAADQSAYSTAAAVYTELQAVAGIENVTIDDAYIDKVLRERFPGGEYDPTVNSVTMPTKGKALADGEISAVVGVAYVCVDGASKKPCA
jgi:hypothetical protein